MRSRDAEIARAFQSFATPFDGVLVGFVLYAAFHWAWFMGGFGWFLLLGLSPRAWRQS